MSQESKDANKNVLVIGESGVGKSSLLNLILGHGQNTAATSNSALRCTFSITKYNHGDGYVLVDTVGYNDTFEANPTAESFANLARMARDIKSKGISLIIFVMKLGKISSVSKTNYDFFVSNFCAEQVPVLLVITHCENEAADECAWYTSKKETFEELGMMFNDAVSGCCIDELIQLSPNLDPEMRPILAQKRERTRSAIQNRIDLLALRTPWKPTTWSDWTVKIFTAAAVNSSDLAKAKTLLEQLPHLVDLLGEEPIELLREVLEQKLK